MPLSQSKSSATLTVEVLFKSKKICHPHNTNDLSPSQYKCPATLTIQIFCQFHLKYYAPLTIQTVGHYHSKKILPLSQSKCSAILIVKVLFNSKKKKLPYSQYKCRVFNRCYRASCAQIVLPFLGHF